METMERFVPAMCRVAQSASGATSTCACSVLPCAETLRAQDSSRSALKGAWNMRFIFIRVERLDRAKWASWAVVLIDRGSVHEQPIADTMSYVGVSNISACLGLDRTDNITSPQ